MRVLIFILLVLFETSCNNKTHKEAEQNTTPSSYEQDSLTMTEIPSSNQCSCQNDSLFLTELALYWKNQMVICGNIVERRTNDTFLVSACLIKNCKDGSEIVNYTDDYISTVILIKQKNTLIVQETRFILNSEDKVDIIPSTEVRIKVVGDSMLVSPSKNIFSPPKLTQRQNDSLNNLCKNLKVHISQGQSHYPCDYPSIYLLYMGALNGNKEAEFLFQKLDSLFELDGAIAETRGEIWIH